ncbi:MAG: acetate--CoA ligase family protein, partial [Candidatus Aenigmarchaeota archaeon]|nr:acetate--CoA ligase family protein [Candidatus Aenigmarchaeota archaeon]
MSETNSNIKLQKHLTEPEAYKLFEKYGMPVAKYLLIKSTEELEKVRSEFGNKQLVLKVVARDITHKSDIGGIGFVDIPEQLEEVYNKIAENGRKHSNLFEGVLAQEKIKGHELLIGGKYDPIFGHVIMFGSGGVYTEVWKDYSLGVLPINNEETKELISGAKAGKIISGYRGLVNCKDAVEKMLIAVGKMIEKENIEELDINPLIVNGGKCFACDAVVNIKDKKESHKHKVKKNIDKLFEPKSVAIVGASAHEGKIGNIIAKNFLKESFKGKFYFVNPKGGEISGNKIYKSIEDIQEQIDLCVIVVPAPYALPVIKQCNAKNIPAAILISAGFSEIGDKKIGVDKTGRELEKELLEIVKQKDIRLLGPNCLGIVNPRTGV